MNKDDIRRICNTSRQRELCCSGFDCECDKPGEAGSAGAEAESRRIEDALLALVPAEALPTPPQRYNVSVYEGGEYSFWESHSGDWVKWDDIASQYMNNGEGTK